MLRQQGSLCKGPVAGAAVVAEGRAGKRAFVALWCWGGGRGQGLQGLGGWGVSSRAVGAVRMGAAGGGEHAGWGHEQQGARGAHALLPQRLYQLTLPSGQIVLFGVLLSWATQALPPRAHCPLC